VENKFAIIIPTYNRPQKLKRAIKSALRQRYDNYKIYVVDDCSSCAEENKVIVESFNSNKISYNLFVENHGHCFARNAVLTYIEDEDVWVKYLDDDDIIFKNCLRDFNEFINNNQQVNVITSNYLKVSDGREVKKPNYNIESVFDGTLDTCCICHHISMYSNFGGWDDRLYRMADDDFFFNYISNGRYGYLDKTTSLFFDTDDKDRVTNLVGNLRYLKIIADKYKNRFCKYKCLVHCDDISGLNNVDFPIESFIKFDLNERSEDEYDVFVQLKRADDIVDLFDRFYKSKDKKTVVKVGNSMLVSKYEDN
jgi:putative colanic acid biosynthesis glycosyl transferase wcaA